MRTNIVQGKRKLTENIVKFATKDHLINFSLVMQKRIQKPTNI